MSGVYRGFDTVCRRLGISCKAVPAAVVDFAGMRRLSAARGARVGAAESFACFIPLFGGAAFRWSA
jgi:hypothetical protein